MKKRILFCILFCVILAGCSYEELEKKPESTFIVVEEEMGFNVVYHRDTKVMYTVSHSSYNMGNFTLLVNPDGSPMLYEDGVNDGQ